MIYRVPGVLALTLSCVAAAASIATAAVNAVPITVDSTDAIAGGDGASRGDRQHTADRNADSPIGEAADLDAVMHLLAMRRHGRVEFVEQQFLAVLKRPIESFGDMSYDAPDRLEKRTLKPRPETLLLEGGVLTVEKGHSRRVVDLHAYPQILPFIESIRATLAGDRAALERVFRVDFAVDGDRWTLILVPLDRQVAKNVARVQIAGSGDQLRRIEIFQADGDRSLMTLRPIAAP